MNNQIITETNTSSGVKKMSTKYIREYHENAEAICVSNYYGQLLRANPKFCKMFAYSEADVQWRYQGDIHKSWEDWEQLQNTVERLGHVENFYARLRHRKGRSFHCLISREKVINENTGRIEYWCRIQKVSITKARNEGVLDLQKSLNEGMLGRKGGQVFLTVCKSCQKVKDAQGDWKSLEPIRMQSNHSIRGKNYCPECTAKLFPDLTLSEITAYSETAMAK
jgi:PAS domain S-box-containing protein